MMAYLLSLPVLVLFLMMQMVVVGRIHLLSGSADIVLLLLIAWAMKESKQTIWLWCGLGGILVALISATPLYVPLVAYLLTVILVRFIKQRVWQMPLLVMLLATIAGTLITQGLYIAVLKITGSPISIQESISLVMMPSILLNLAFALPIYAIVTDLVSWVFPSEEQE